MTAIVGNNPQTCPHYALGEAVDVDDCIKEGRRLVDGRNLEELVECDQKNA